MRNSIPLEEMELATLQTELSMTATRLRLAQQKNSDDPQIVALRTQVANLRAQINEREQRLGETLRRIKHAINP